VTLLPGEDARSAAPPTQDAAAYEEYLAALDLLSQANALRDDAELRTPLVKARSLLESALRRDAEFALAHAALARAQITIWFYLRDDPVAVGAREASLQEALAALKLQPSLPEAHRELGRYYYWGHFGLFERREIARGRAAGSAERRGNRSRARLDSPSPGADGRCRRALQVGCRDSTQRS
jgi:hypothetical protein